LSAVEDLTSADDFLPQARLLERYQPRYEGTSSVQELEDLATEAADVVAAAERTSAALADLQASANDWTIPTAVTEPLENGRINTGFAIVNDARAVVKAATDANLALPDANLRAEIQPRFEAVTTGEEMAALRLAAEARRDQAESIGGALAALRLQDPEWQTPAVISDPIATGDFATAAEVAAVAKSWIENAYEANTTLPAMDAINRSQQDFEAATTLDELKAGASRAENWNLAADRVAEAQVAIDRPRDLMAEFGLWGVDLQPPLREAVQAAIDGDLTLALNRAATVIETANGASSGGALRLAGIVFLGVAILGVLGLWLILRREAGPPWARSTKPHWVDDKKDGPRLLGRGKTNGKKNDKKGK
jgi:hypothetical protein